MSKEQIEEMRKDLIEIFDEEYEKRRLITADFTAIRLAEKCYRKQSENTIELPCKVGDSIYRVVKGKVKEDKIEKIEINKNTISIYFDWHGMGYECCMASQIGKTVFLTREEAESNREECV